jgi:hypothetical protein
MSSSKPPKPSKQELQLMESQRGMLEQQRVQLQEQSRQQELLGPALYESMGLRPRYENGQIVGYDRFETPEQGLYREQIEAMRRQQPVQEQLQQQYLTLAEQQARYQQEQAPMQQRLQEQYLTLAEQQARYQAEQMPLQQRLQQQYLTLAEQQAAYQAEQQAWQTELRPELKRQTEMQTALQGQMLEYQQSQLRQEQERQRLQPLLYEASGVRPIYDEAGNITSFGLTEEAQARKDYENQLLDRQRKALAGELPVDPTLERALTEGETQLRAQLQAQLGTDYETSSPGIQALEEYRKRAAEARSTVAHGQLTSGQQLLQTQTQMNQDQMARATRGGTGLLGNYGLQPVSFGGQVAPGGMPNALSLYQSSGQGVPNALGTYQGISGNLFQAGSPAATAAGYQGALSGQFGTLGEYARLAQGFGQAAGTMGQFGERQNRYAEQARAANASQWGQIGTIAGSVLGGVAGTVVPGFGTAAGAAAGATLGGAAGNYYGSTR